MVVVVPVVLVGSAAEAEGAFQREPDAVAISAALTSSVAPSPESTGGPIAKVAPASPAWGWPLQPRPAVLAGFDPPDVAWGSGHRGVDLAASVGQAVLAPSAGVVSFSGVVVDRGVVVVMAPSGLRSTLEPVTGTVTPGTPVALGDVIGQVGAEASHCRPLTCLHWGVLRGETYLDPLALLGLRRVVLLPLRPVRPP